MVWSLRVTGLQTQLNSAECFIFNPNAGGQNCMMDSFADKFSGHLGVKDGKNAKKKKQ